MTIDHQRIGGGKSFWINGLTSAAKPFDSLPGRPYTPPVQSVVPISQVPLAGSSVDPRGFAHRRDISLG
jgi:hypothetical protein